MESITKSIEYVLDNSDRFLEALQVHLGLSFLALWIGIVICVPLGVVCAKNFRVAGPIMNLINAFRVIPSLAILVIVFPILGAGFWPALVALTVLACPPILINTYLGFREINPFIIEAALGMGMNKRQMLRKIEFPLAIPVIIAGCRTAAVEVIASATLAAFIGGGGLGTFIINGLGMYNIPLILVGALPVAMLAVSSEIVLASVERMATRYRRA